MVAGVRILVLGWLLNRVPSTPPMVGDLRGDRRHRHAADVGLDFTAREGAEEEDKKKDD